jgi:hypothetical protein
MHLADKHMFSLVFRTVEGEEPKAEEAAAEGAPAEAAAAEPPKEEEKVSGAVVLE